MYIYSLYINRYSLYMCVEIVFFFKPITVSKGTTKQKLKKLKRKKFKNVHQGCKMKEVIWRM